MSGWQNLTRHRCRHRPRKNRRGQRRHWTKEQLSARRGLHLLFEAEAADEWMARRIETCERGGYIDTETGSPSEADQPLRPQGTETQQAAMEEEEEPSKRRRTHPPTIQAQPSPQKPRPSRFWLMPILIGHQVPLSQKPSSCKFGRQPRGGVPHQGTGDTPRRTKPEGFESWDTDEIPGTETEDEAWGHARRRRSADTMADTMTSTATTRPTGPTTARKNPSDAAQEPQPGGPVGLNWATHRRNRVHALSDPSW